ncbi:MAG: Ltp family lipoprotein [Anaerolineaceae bacterium]|nr:Ltp family lipoprotein [Anaerolineaceae bacterium]
MQRKQTQARLLTFFVLMLILFPFPGTGRIAANPEKALETAKMYIESIPFSRTALIEQLEMTGYTSEEAAYAADNCGADWNEMAVRSAEAYLSSSDYSESALIRQLESKTEKFTHEQAVYGVTEAGRNVDWDEMAVRRASFYLRSSALSKEGLIRLMESENVGFTHDQAVHSAEIAGQDIDWNEMAVKRSLSLLENTPLSESGLIRQLESESIGFTHEQAVYGAANLGTAVNWNDMALKRAEIHLKVRSMSRDELIAVLESESEGFTHEQAVYAADLSGLSGANMTEILQNNLDNLFPIRALEEKFTTPQQPSYSDMGPETSVQMTNQDGLRTYILFANADSVHDYNYVVPVNSGHMVNFMFSMDIVINDVYPKGQAGCFVGYINEFAASRKEEEAAVTLLMADGNGVGFYHKTAGEDAGNFTRISEDKGNKYTLTIMRFTGQTYAFLNNIYIGQFAEPLEGPFRLVYGSSVLRDGDNASCSFDNLSVRKVNNQP